MYLLRAAGTYLPTHRSGFPEDAALAAQRERREAGLRAYYQAALPRVQSAQQAAAAARTSGDRKAAAAAMAALEGLRAGINGDAERLMYGTEPGDHAAYLLAFGCTKCTDAAAAACKRRGPLTEVGAGRGHWQRALAAAGVDVAAVDDGSLRAPAPEPVGAVARGDGVAAAAAAGPLGRALLIVYPDPSPFAAQCVARYSGRTVLYAGEGRGGPNADAAFFDALDRDFAVVETVPLDPFKGGTEKLYVLERRGPAAALLPALVLAGGTLLARALLLGARRPARAEGAEAPAAPAGGGKAGAPPAPALAFADHFPLAPKACAKISTKLFACVTASAEHWRDPLANPAPPDPLCASLMAKYDKCVAKQLKKKPRANYRVPEEYRVREGGAAAAAAAGEE